MIKGMTPVISAAIFLIILLSLSGFGYVYISQYSSMAEKTISIPLKGSVCSNNGAEIILKNLGTKDINLNDETEISFSFFGNLVPNPGFEKDMNNNGKPDDWGETTKQTRTDVILVTDLSNSMSDCMDPKDITPDMDTVMLFHFDEGSGDTVQDSSSYNNNGILGNALGSDSRDPSFVTDGRFSGALRFDNDYIQVQNNETLTYMEELTIEAWVYIEVINSRMTVAGKHYREYEMIIDDYGSELRLYKTDKYDGGYSYESAGYDYDFNAGEWYHVAITWKGNRAVFYINGEGHEVYDSDLADRIEGENDFNIGRRVGGSNYFSGMIDEVAVHRRELSGDEIRSHAKQLTRAECPDDGNPDKPAWCRYETSLCPAQNPNNEHIYLPSSYYTPPTFRRVDFNKGFSVFPSMICSYELGCGSGICESLGKVYNNDWNIISEVSRDYCLVGECFIDDEYSDCAWYPRTDNNIAVCGSLGIPYDIDTRMDSSVCKASCDPLEYYYDNCDCSWTDRTVCGSSVCSPSQTDEGTGSVSSLRDSCLPSECTGNVRYSDFFCNEDAACGSGYTECQECTDCDAFETCCCDTSTSQYECIQERDYCCNSQECRTYSDECCYTVQDRCGSLEFECCDPLFACEPVSIVDTSPCVPGFVDERPDPDQECTNSWQCRAESGSCYICDSVAIRLAKSVDKSFINDIFSHNSDLLRIGLVSYGSSVSDSGGLDDYREKDNIINAIDSYASDQGETCISCAIERAVEILINSGDPTSEKFIVLMSDGVANVRDYYATTDQNGDGLIDAKDDAIARACDATANHNIIFYTVGFGKEAGLDTLQAITDCSGTTGRYFHGENPSELFDIYEEIGESIGRGFLTDDKVYGKYAMKLAADEDPPMVESEKFQIMIDDSESYILSFYRKLELSQGTMRTSMSFFDDGDNLIGEQVLQESNSPVSDTDYNKIKLPVTVPDVVNSKKASIKFVFEGAAPTDRINIDDVYFGPEPKCQESDGNYVCGDLTIIKTSRDGDIYPYVSNATLEPNSVLKIKDGNCKGKCEYKIISKSNAVDVTVNCP